MADSETTITEKTPSPDAADSVDASGKSARRRKEASLSSSDRWTLWGMVGFPTFLHVSLIWIPAFATVLLSFVRWNGFKLSQIKFIGLGNYVNLFTVWDKDLYEGLLNNLWVLIFLFVIATPLGMLLAYLLDKELRGTAVYQSLLYFPVVLSLAVVGFIWKSVIYSPRQGLLNTTLGRTEQGNQIDWLGNPEFVLPVPFTENYGLSANFLALIVPMIWQHVGYIMVLYLAGMKSVDPSLREAAAIDGSSEWQAFRKVIVPSLRPVNIVMIVITVITGLRIFDIIDVLNNPIGTDVLSILVAENLLGESTNVGRGSAFATVLLVLCFGFVLWYLRNTFSEELE